MAYKITKLRPKDYKISGSIIVGLDRHLEGSLYQTSDDGQRWNWLIGYRIDPRDRGVWLKGKCKTMREAKGQIHSAYARLSGNISRKPQRQHGIS